MSFFPKVRFIKALETIIAIHPANWFTVFTGVRQVEEPLDERHGQLILAITRYVTRAIGFAENWISNIYVWWVAHNEVIALPENALEFLRIFRVIEVLKAVPI